MNSCIMTVQITEAPQLRYTQDNQLAIAEMKVQFAALRPEEEAAEVKAIGWGNLAQDIVNKYKVGDQVLVEGRLGMTTIDRPEGFKEKRAELTISRIHDISGLDAGVNTAGAAPAMSAPPATTATASVEEEDFDEIPF